MISVRNKLKSISNFLDEYRQLIDCHMVNYFTQRLWENNVPINIREETKNFSLNEILLEFWSSIDTFSGFSCQSIRPKPENICKFISDARSCYLDSNKECLNPSELQDLMKSWGCADCNTVLDQSFMSSKKSHEVEAMSSVVASMCNALKCSHVIDIGGGKGYLSSVLFLQHKLKVLGLDSSSSNTHVATKRTEKMQKVWNGIRKRIESGDSARRKGKHWKAKSITTPIENIEDNSMNLIKTDERKKQNDQLVNALPKVNEDLNITRNHSCTNGIVNTHFKQATHFVNSETKLLDILDESYPDDSVLNSALTGLHTCGNLASSCLKLFVNDVTGRLKFLVNVGCCYHLLTEKYQGLPLINQSMLGHCRDDHNFETHGDGFPMSEYLCSKQYSLSYNSRVLSSQSVDRISKENKLPSDTLFYRALFEVLLLHHDFIKDGESNLFCVGRINCSSFNEYVTKAIKKLGLNLEVSEAELDKLYDDYKMCKDELYIYFMMRVTMAPVIEALILLDRLLYLYENGIEDAYLVRLFNPVTSPRCYGIVALRKTGS